MIIIKGIGKQSEDYLYRNKSNVEGASLMYPSRKNPYQADHKFSTDYYMDSQAVNSLSTSKELSLGRKKKKSKKKSNSMMAKKQNKKRNSFIQKLTKKKEAELSEETAASIGNMKRQFIDHNYFGILFNKNQIKPKNKSVKRTKGVSETMNVKNLFSPQKQFELMKSMESSMKRKHSKMTKSSDLTHHASSTNYTPKLRSEGYSG